LDARWQVLESDVILREIEVWVFPNFILDASHALFSLKVGFTFSGVVFSATEFAKWSIFTCVGGVTNLKALEALNG
jgi:hypothetical protein